MAASTKAERFEVFSKIQSKPRRVLNQDLGLGLIAGISSSQHGQLTVHNVAWPAYSAQCFITCEGHSERNDACRGVSLRRCLSH